MKKSTTLINDGHATLWVDYEPASLGEGVVSIGVSDDGGFSSVYVSFEGLEQLKKDIDGFLKEIKK